jgi:hypothetical protein
VSSRGEAFRIATERESELTIVFLRDKTDLSHTGLVEVCNPGRPNCGGYAIAERIIESNVRVTIT